LVRTFKLVVGYDGTDFHGWQRQSEQRTVQGVLEDALREVLEDEALTIEGAGRTDAGVHARGQTVSFTWGGTLPARALAPLLHRRLPPDVRVRAVGEAPQGFSARRSAVARRYAYRLLHREDVLLERFAWHPQRRLDPDRLARATRVLEGEHDCSSFQSSGSTPRDPRCRVTRASWTAEDRMLRFDVIADHFLYRMVRNIVGTAMTAAQSADPAGAMGEILAARDRRRAGFAAPARGLTLEAVFYPTEGLS
jgi:tRNA pseudouridine38-40 synthase